MGLLKTFVNLLDEDSDQSFENKLDHMLGQAERLLGTTLDKAENGIKSVDKAISRVDTAAGTIVKKSDAAMKRLDHLDRTNTKIMDVVTKKSDAQ